MVLEHGSPLGLDGQCVGHAFMLVTYVFLILVAYGLVAYAWCCSWSHLCHHVKVYGVVVGCDCHECMSVMHCYACQCLHVVMHALSWLRLLYMRSFYAVCVIMMLLVCYDANMLAKIE